mgnify:CR=1 FL=1|tara:strand:+ start:45433 stop:45861 length:429 start_codon:yes stop_codon:yes gene_type:complete
MLMQVKTNGATDLIINIPVEKVEYVQDMLRMFETNVVAVQKDYYGAKGVKLDCTITVGSSVKFEGGEPYNEPPRPDLIIHAGESTAILEKYEALPMEQMISVKDQMKKLHEKNTKLSEENNYLKQRVSRLEEELQEQEEKQQ